MRFTRTPIVEAISTLGLAPDDIDLVINCHLHADHAGGNVHFRGTPISSSPLSSRRPAPTRTTPSRRRWTSPMLAGRCMRASTSRFGIRVIPTQGHSPGHQSVAIDTDRGRLILAGQVFATRPPSRAR